MGYTSLSRSVKLGPEDQAAHCFANDLRVAVLQNRLKAVFCHVPNELAGMVIHTKGKARVPVLTAIARALGLITGAADYLFLFDGGSCAIEFKSSTGRLTPPQRDFREWCRLTNVPFHIARSSDEGQAILREYGVLS